MDCNWSVGYKHNGFFSDNFPHKDRIFESLILAKKKDACYHKICHNEANKDIL